VVTRHSSRIDIFGVPLFVSLLMKEPGQSVGMTAMTIVTNNRLFARMVRKLGGLSAYKEQGLSAAPLLEAYNLLRQGKILGVAPEGEIAWDGHLQPLKPGVAWLALRTHTPLVPAVLRGGYDIWPRWARWPHFSGKLVFQVGDPFYVSATPCERVSQRMIREANDRIAAELEKVSEGYLVRRGARR
jgi:1-acyl-sn-glycerol-3-phosphate acyltransferase